MHASLFRIYSLGQAASNLPVGSKQLEVHLSEIMGYVDGEVACASDSHEVSGEDAHGAKYAQRINTTKTHTATWFPFKSNSPIPPSIRRGERVVIWRAGDADKYYWTESGLDDHLRRKDTVILAVSDVSTNSDETPGLESCYFIECSSHNKCITLQTSKADSETYRHTLQMNGGEGTTTLTDDVNNHILLNSPESLIRLHTKEGNYLELQRKNLVGDVKGSVSLTAAKSVTIKAPSNTVDGDLTVNGDTTINGALKTKSLATDSMVCKGICKASKFIEG